MWGGGEAEKCTKNENDVEVAVHHRPKEDGHHNVLDQEPEDSKMQIAEIGQIMIGLQTLISVRKTLSTGQFRTEFGAANIDCRAQKRE